MLKHTKRFPIVKGNAPRKSNGAVKRMQDRAKNRAFANRTAAKLSR